MSYDLYFYIKKNSRLTESKITQYLDLNLSSTSENRFQWFVEDEDTEAYFSICLQEAETDPESIEIYENFIDFDNTHFTFNLNFLRPDFFGKFAFEFIQKFIDDLDLYVLNPQSKTDSDKPSKPIGQELYKNWSEINAKNSGYFYKEYGLKFYPLEKSNEFYSYNHEKKVLEAKLGEKYSVPKLFLFQRKFDEKIITISLWIEHLPSVFPPADYFLISKNYKKGFKTIKEDGLISLKTFEDRFGSFLENINFLNCKIIYPHSAEKIKALFNSTIFEYTLGEFAERVEIEKLVNVKPNE